MGCLTILLLIGFAWFGGISFAVPVTPNASPPTAPALVTEVVFGAAANSTDEQIQTAVEVIDRRLTALDITHEVTTSDTDGEIIVRLPGLEDQQSVLVFIQQQGYLELVDLSGVGSTIGFEGATIWTTGQAERLGSPPNEALPHPETGEPFETVIDGAAVTSAEPILDQFGQWTI